MYSLNLAFNGISYVMIPLAFNVGLIYCFSPLIGSITIGNVGNVHLEYAQVTTRDIECV